jgi:hypothetical protein
MHDLTNGLRCELSVCRRVKEGEMSHFDRVFALYDKPFFRPGQLNDPVLFKAVLNQILKEYDPLFQPDLVDPPDVVATMSHQHRLYMNAYLNEKQAQYHIDNKHWLNWTQGTLKGATLQPQSCWIWPGMVVVGSVTTSRGDLVTNGIHYVVEAIHETKVSLSIHPDYAKYFVEKPAQILDPDVEPDDEQQKLGPKAFELDWEQFALKLRLTHALPYVYYQGKTVKKQTLLLMNTQSRHFTMRHLIMGLGRVQQSSRVWLCPQSLQEAIIEKAKEIYKRRQQEW